jgi:hypothetical protein
MTIYTVICAFFWVLVVPGCSRGRPRPGGDGDGRGRTRVDASRWWWWFWRGVVVVNSLNVNVSKNFINNDIKKQKKRTSALYSFYLCHVREGA